MTAAGTLYGHQSIGAAHVCQDCEFCEPLNLRLSHTLEFLQWYEFKVHVYFRWSCLSPLPDEWKRDLLVAKEVLGETPIRRLVDVEPFIAAGKEGHK